MSNHCLYISVPSRAPTNVRVENYGLNELLVKWNSIPPQYANGRLLGYNVYYKRTQYYYYSDSIVSINNTNTPSAILPNIQIGERYQISVAAFTSTGLGPRSPLIYITKGKSKRKKKQNKTECKTSITSMD